MAVDLHVHSSASDGTDPPGVVVAKAAEIGLSAVALTDHDTLTGIPAARSAANGLPIELIPGVELSVDHDPAIAGLLSLCNTKEERREELRLALDQNYPNPFNPQTTIQYHLQRPGDARISIFDLQGRLVRTLVEGARDAGPHSVIWNGTNDRGQSVPAGTYVYRL